MVVAKYFLYSGLGYDNSVDLPDTASGKMGVVQQSAICFEIFGSKSGISFVVCKPRILVLDQWTNAGQGISRCVGSARNVLEGDVALLHIGEPSYKPRRKVRGGLPMPQGTVVRVCDDPRTVHVVTPIP